MSTEAVVLEVFIWTLIGLISAWMILECCRSTLFWHPVTPPHAKDTIIIEPLPHQNVMVRTANPVMVTSSQNGQMIWNQAPPPPPPAPAPTTAYPPPSTGQVVYYVPTTNAQGQQVLIPQAGPVVAQQPQYVVPPPQQQQVPLVQQFAVQSPMSGISPVVLSPLQSPRMTQYPTTTQQMVTGGVVRPENK